MKIDRERARKVFNEYVEKYDSSVEKIKLKIDHTLRVSELCEKIALSLNMSKEDIDLAWLTGLLHDIGRFEQVRRYGTFNDAKSINHGKLGVEILFAEGKIRDFIDDRSEDELIKKVIGCHNAYTVPSDYSEREITFSNILRDADKVDIFKVNIIMSAEDVYGVTKEELENTEITEAVLDSFKKKETVLRSLKKTAVDHRVGHISLVFGLIYDESIRITIQQGYLNEMIKFKSKLDSTNEQFKEIKKVVESYINERINKKM